MMTRSKSKVRVPVQRVDGRNNELQTADDEKISEEADVDTKPTDCQDEITRWRDTALRLQADMQNYHKRQQRWAQDEVHRKQDQLLLGFISIVDDLEKVISHLDLESVTHQGVKITYDNMLKLLAQQGVERIEAQHLAFDPMWHEAVAMVPGSPSQSVPLIVTEVISHGYRIGDRLLRPSQVVVSKR